MKRRFAIALAMVLSLGILAGCGGTAQQKPQADAPAAADADKVKVVCATFPAYDWARQIVGDAADDLDTTDLMSKGTDLHNFQPSVEDMAKIADSDLFVYVGGESDAWAEDAVKAAGRSDLHTVSLLAAVGDAAVEEEVVVTGVFETYAEGEARYLHLVNASVRPTE